MPKQTDYLFYSWYNGEERITDEFAMPASDVTLSADWVYAKEIYTQSKVRVDADTAQNHTLLTEKSAEDWEKIYEYGSTANIHFFFHIKEIDEGYQEVTLKAIGEAYRTTLFKDTTIETNGGKKGSADYNYDYTLTKDEVRQGFHILLDAHGSLEDDYEFNATITVTILPLY